jgi:iron complex outermembrane receptor protein
MRAIAFGLALAISALPCSPVAAQRPAELVGLVRDAEGAPVESASLELVEARARVLSDAAGRYRFRAVSAGRYTLQVTRVGYARRTLAIDVEAGRIQVLDVELVASPVALDEVAVSVPAPRDPGARLERADIERSGARSAGDLVRALPGVVVRATSPGGPVTVSVRGGAADAVLVLVDGVVLNDPLTGEADLSTVSADAIQSLQLLPGARSARYGPRAEAGVILIETRLETPARELEGSVGSLGTASAGAVWGASRPLAWGMGTEWSTLEGVFDFDVPEEAGGGSGRRENADARTVGGWVSAQARVAGGDVRIRGTGERVDRGLPGRSYAPSRLARQTVERLQGATSWDRTGERSSLRLSVALSHHTVRFSDTGPPFGLPYDDTARVRSVDLRAEGERRSSWAGIAWGAGLEARRQTVRASALREDVPADRGELGVFGHASLPLRIGVERLVLSGELRADRDLAGGWTLSRSLTLASATLLGLDAHAALRSSYSPPTLADQYFRAEVGVEPNPELAGERVPWEVEVGVARGLTLGAARADLVVTAYRGDVRGMIVWAPDFRFVWSPRNVDVRRVGVESRATLSAWEGRARLLAFHSYTRVVYDRLPPDYDVQVIYRPRHTASVEVGWQDDPWLFDLSARFTGVRYPVPARVNALSSFWTTRASFSRAWLVRGWTITPALRADRIFGERESLIFGFPEPGRTLRVDLTLRPSRNLPDGGIPR